MVTYVVQEDFTHRDVWQRSKKISVSLVTHMTFMSQSRRPHYAYNGEESMKMKIISRVGTALYYKKVYGFVDT